MKWAIMAGWESDDGVVALIGRLSGSRAVIALGSSTPPVVWRWWAGGEGTADGGSGATGGVRPTGAVGGCGPPWPGAHRGGQGAPGAGPARAAVQRSGVAGRPRRRVVAGRSARHRGEDPAGPRGPRPAGARDDGADRGARDARP